jgi:hypothetical protein
MKFKQSLKAHGTAREKYQNKQKMKLFKIHYFDEAIKSLKLKYYMQQLCFLMDSVL